MSKVTEEGLYKCTNCGGYGELEAFGELRRDGTVQGHCKECKTRSKQGADSRARDERLDEVKGLVAKLRGLRLPHAICEKVVETGRLIHGNVGPLEYQRLILPEGANPETPRWEAVSRSEVVAECGAGALERIRDGHEEESRCGTAIYSYGRGGESTPSDNELSSQLSYDWT